LMGAFMTAAYMGRCVFLTFHGEYRGHGHPHESPRSMTVPLVLLAIPSALIGLINVPGLEKFTDWVRFEVPGLRTPFEIPEHKFNPGLALLSLAIAIAGLLVAAMVFYWKNAPAKGAWTRVPAFRALNTFLVEKYYLDHLFVDGVVGSIKGPIARAAYWVDQKGVDGVVNGVGIGASETGGVLRLVQSGRVQQYALMLFAAVGLLGLALILFT